MRLQNTMTKLSIDPNDIQTLINKGRSLSQLHDFEGAILNYDKVLKIEPQNIDALINKGLALYNLGKNADAIAHFNKVLEFDPGNELASNLRINAEHNAMIPK